LAVRDSCTTPALVGTETLAGAHTDISPTAHYVLVGEIVGLFGTRGWFKVRTFTRPRQNLFSYRAWWIGHPARSQLYSVSATQTHGTSYLAQLAGIENRDQASSLVNQPIHIARELLPPAGEDEYYWADLVGMQVVTLAGESLGTVRGLQEAGDHDVLIIRGAREYLIPFVQKHFVMQVDNGQNRITVDWHVDD
jgi:16S rRNA processing protein RimM